MTVVSRQELLGLGSNLIQPFTAAHVTPIGYDFTAGTLAEMRGNGKLHRGGKMLPLYDVIDPIPLFYTHESDGMGWSVLPGLYFLTFQEMVSIPHDMLGQMLPRSTLLRMGATLETAWWDAGYSGVSATILNVFNPWGIEIERGARVGHMVFHRLDEISDSPYAGSYQGERGVV